MELTQHEIDRVIACEKYVTAYVRWSERARRIPRREVSFSVLVPDPGDPAEFAIGRIEGVTHRYGTRFAFIYENVCIVRWESTGPHRNPDGRWIAGQHKHRWSEVHEDRSAYEPDDIDESGVDAALFSFLRELNITFEGTYEPTLPGVRE